MTPDEVLKKIADEHNCHVCFTGGEPLLQYEALLEVLKFMDGYNVSIETNGAVPIKERPNVMKFIMDIKCPGSGAPKSYYKTAFQNVRELDEENDELKFVVADDRDLEFVEGILEDLPFGLTKIMSPVWGSMDYQHLAKFVMAHGTFNMMMQIQLHKIIWGPTKRGV
jgi:7-carboxy-7-deazaguanine synthase